jgi:hypothetical protein
LDTVKAKMTAVQESANKVGSSIGGVLNHLTMATGAIVGFATAGVALSVTGQLMTFQIERLSRTISGLFGPEIRKLIDFISKLTDWINKLNAEQKRQIAYLLEGAIAFVALTKILPFFTGMVISATTAVVDFAAAIMAGEIATGIGALIPLLGLAAAALGGFLVATETGRGILGKLWETLKPLGDGFLKVVDAVSELFEAFVQGVEATGGIQAVFAAIGNVIAALIAPLKSLTPVFMLLGEMVGRVAGYFARFIDIVGVWASAWSQEMAVGLELVIELFNLLFDLVSTCIELFLGFAKVIVSVVVFALKMLTAVLTGLVWIVQMLDAALRWLFGIPARKEFEISTKRTGDNRGQDMPRVGGPESLAAMYDRIAQASQLIGGPKTDAEKQLEKLDKISDNTKRAADALDNAPPLVGG